MMFLTFRFPIKQGKMLDILSSDELGNEVFDIPSSDKAGNDVFDFP